MSASTVVPAEILTQYGIDRSATLVDLNSAGGFSGAHLWRFHWQGRDYCLRQWPRRHPSEERLRLVHDVIVTAGRRLDFIAVPLETARGERFVRRGDHLWELAPWLPGEANYRQHPSGRKLQAALTALAKFHLAVQDVKPVPVARPSPGMLDRLKRLDHFAGEGAARIDSAIPTAGWPVLVVRAQALLHHFRQQSLETRKLLQQGAIANVAQQPCLRDIWHDHVLFVEEEVTGIVDYGAVNLESVSADIARLLGSLALENPADWSLGLAAYEELRPLTKAERQLVAAFDAANVLMSGMNWLEWILVEGREFEDREGVLKRIDESLQRLEHRSLKPGAARLIEP